ncbi:steryl-sulfatase-like [Saccoglossus kowalevskii]
MASTMLISLLLCLVFFTRIIALTKPNVVIILVDDMGYGNLGCYGNKYLQTPNIEGLKFTHMYSSPTCTPSRAALMTGRLPIRSGMLRGRLLPFSVLCSPAQIGGLDPEEITLAEVFKEHGYATALIGKWHLGIGSGGKYLPTNHGFDYFYGLPMTDNDSHVVYRLLTHYIARKIYVHLIGALFILKIFSPVRGRTFNILVISSILLVTLILKISLLDPSSCILMRNDDVIQQPYKAENMTLRVTDILNHTVSNHVIDGKSLLSLLRDPRSAPPHDYLFHYCANALIPAMTYGKYKIHFVDQYTDNECYSAVVMPTPVIYNLDDDPGEQRPLSTSESADIQLLVKDILSEHESTTPNHLFTQLDTLMLPWLFPCSNFPFCHQELEEKEDFSDLNHI